MTVLWKMKFFWYHAGVQMIKMYVTNTSLVGFYLCIFCAQYEVKPHLFCLIGFLIGISTWPGSWLTPLPFKAAGRGVRFSPWSPPNSLQPSARSPWLAACGSQLLELWTSSRSLWILTSPSNCTAHNLFLHSQTPLRIKFKEICGAPCAFEFKLNLVYTMSTCFTDARLKDRV